MVGFIRIGVDGTGSNIAPIYNFVETCLFSQGHSQTEMCTLAKVGLGCIGVVSE